MHTLTTIAGALKNVYEPRVAKQTFEKVLIYNTVRKNMGVKSADGKRVYITLHNDRNSGAGLSISENEALPTAGYQQFAQAYADQKYTFSQIELTDQVIEGTKSNKAALVNALDSEYQGAKDDMKRQICRQWYGLGTGEVCKVNGNLDASATTITVDTPMTGPNATHFLVAGHYIYAGTATDYLHIASVDSATQFTADANSLNLADNEALYLAASGTVNCKDKEMMGLKGLVDDASYLDTLQNIARSSYAWWKSYVSDNSDTLRDLDEDDMLDCLFEAEKYGEVKMIVTTFGVLRKYYAILAADKRYPNTVELTGGFSGISFQATTRKLAIVPDHDSPKNEMYFLDTDHISVEEMTPMSFMDADGAVLARSATKAAYQATLRYYANMATDKPRASSALRYINE